MSLVTGPQPPLLAVSTLSVRLSLCGVSPASCLSLCLFLSPSPTNPLLNGIKGPLLPHSEQS